MATNWPESGRCGACGQPAHRYPSGRWNHDGFPCPVCVRFVWTIDDLDIRDALRFIPDGEPLPTAPEHAFVDDPAITVRAWLIRHTGSNQ